MVQRGGDNPVSMDSRSPEQEIIRCLSVDDIACHFWFKVSNLASETNLAQRVTTPSIEAIDGYSYGLQHAWRDVKKVEKPLRDDTESRLWINLVPFDACRANVPSIVQRSIMLIIFEEHVLKIWYLSLHQMALGTRSPIVFSRDYQYLYQKGLW